MNRAILIVICDFLVSSMLSMMTGMVPAHTGGTGVGLDETTTRMLLAELESQRSNLDALRAKLREATAKLGSTPEREAELRRLTAQLAANMRRTEEVKSAQTRSPETTGKLTPEQLKAMLDKANEQRIATEIRLQDEQKDLKETKTELKELRTVTAKSNAEVVKLSRDYAAASAKAQIAEKELAAKEGDLAGVRDVLKEMNARVGRITNEKQTLQTSLAYTSGKLNTAERDAADLRGQVEMLRRRLAEQEVEQRDALRRTEDMKKLVQRSVREASQARSELEQTKLQLENQRKAGVENEVKLKVAEKQVSNLEKQLRNDALANYTAAVVRLEVQLAEERLLATRQGGGVCYLPAVDFGGRKLLVGSTTLLASGSGKPMTFSKVTKLEMLAVKPGQPAAQFKLKGPLLALNRDLRIGALDAAALPVKALPLLTADQLKTRGVQNLYLFKAGAFGKGSTELTGRCSLDLGGSSPVLCIRNTVRGTGSEVKAEPGDLVLTKEGDFVGVVVEGERSDFGRRAEAMAVLFTAPQEWEQARKIPLDRVPGSKYYPEFEQKIRELNAELAKLR